MRVFVDTNIFLDFIQPDRKFTESAKAILNAAEARMFEMYLSTQSIIDSAFVLRKNGFDYNRFSKVLRCLLSFAKVVGIDELDMLWALDHYSGDFEDDMQYASAYNNACDFFITRDEKLQKLNSPINPLIVITPEEFVSKMTSD
ncbi:MAG: PIN domain-containing protein [Bacteroidales bacterium]|nr:PIN domain-containing protein [Bacteroidales bacterium]